MNYSQILSLNNNSLFGLTILRSQDGISTELDGETVILNIASGIYSGLDNIGTFIWNFLKEPATIATLRDAILERYDVTEKQCVDDLLVFLKDLADNGLICCQNELSA
jgi:hypothetical protein